MDIILQNWALILALLAVGGIAGLTAGLFGIGGGAVMVPALYYAFSALGVAEEIVMHCAVATSAAVIILNAFRSTRAHHAKDAVDMSLVWPHPKWWQSYGLWIGVGSFAAAIWIAPRLSGDVLTRLFAGIAVFVSLQFAAAFGLFIAVPATIGFVLSGWSVSGRPFGSLGYVNSLGFALITLSAWPMVPMGAKLAHRMDAAVLRRVFGLCLALVAINMARKTGLF